MLSGFWWHYAASIFWCLRIKKVLAVDLLHTCLYWKCIAWQRISHLVYSKAGVLTAVHRIVLLFRYDVELFLRIEQLLGQKIPVYEPNKDSVMVMMERVTEAQRIAKLVRTSPLHFIPSCFKPWTDALCVILLSLTLTWKLNVILLRCNRTLLSIKMPMNVT